MMKNNNSYLNQAISWKEFEVVVRNCPGTIRFENHGHGNKVHDFQEQAGHDAGVYELNTERILFYQFKEDNKAHMEEFRVKRNNERFGFSVENPSDEIYQKHVSHG